VRRHSVAQDRGALTADIDRTGRTGAVRGLVGKIWLSNGPTVGSVCLFEDRAVADRYLDGMFAEAVTSNPVFADVRVEQYEVDEALSRITDGLGALAVSARS
jgi:hypothetical protein